MQDRISDEKMLVVKNHYLSSRSEVIVLKLDLEIPLVIRILKDSSVYKEAAQSD